MTEYERPLKTFSWLLAAYIYILTLLFSEASLADSNMPLTSLFPDESFLPAQAGTFRYGSAEEITRAGLFASVNVSDDQMYIFSGRTMAPADYLEKTLGIKCYVKGERETGSLSGGRKTGNTDPDETLRLYAVKSGKRLELWAGKRKDLPAAVINGRLYVPLRMVAEPFGIRLHFYPHPDRTVPLVIIDGNGSLTPEQFSQLKENEPPVIVNTSGSYGYNEMLKDIPVLMARYPFIKTEVVGKSVRGRDLVVIKLGNGPREVFYSAAIHPQEWITGPLLMKFAEEYSRAYTSGEDFAGYDPRWLFNQATIYLMPFCNPDGVELVLRGIGRYDPDYEKIMQLNDWSDDFSGWRANMNGVNLNLQFPANWEYARSIWDKVPSRSQYPGAAPLTEPESRAMHDFTLNHDFRLILSFHSQGEIIYWRFYGLEPPESKDIVLKMSGITGYAPYSPAHTSGGYRDWFVQQYGRPGFTIEVGKGVNPLPISQFGGIWEKTAPLMLYAASI
ncbi:MAG: M14 family zinc carboxypeptidase [Bacillota bacterium]